MGAVEVKYKSQRGSHPPGTVVSDPKDWLTTLLVEDFDNFKAQFDSLPEAKQQQILQVMDSDDAMDNKGSAGMWLAEHE